MSDLHQSLMDTAYKRWQANKAMNVEEFHDTLNAQERFAVHTGNFNYQVGNGGFMQWWDNRYGTPATVEFLLRACDRIGTDTAKQVAGLLKQYKKATIRKNLYENTGEDEWEEIRDGLNGLDTAYYDIDEQFMADCEVHLQKGGW